MCLRTFLYRKENRFRSSKCESNCWKNDECVRTSSSFYNSSIKCLFYESTFGADEWEWKIKDQEQTNLHVPINVEVGDSSRDRTNNNDFELHSFLLLVVTTIQNHLIRSDSCFYHVSVFLFDCLINSCICCTLFLFRTIHIASN